MARLTDRQRLVRVLDFLVGAGHPKVQALLATRGFAAADAEEGFRLLREASAGFYSGTSDAPPPEAAVAFLDSWKNRWLPIVQASLGRHFPAVARKVLRNVGPTKGVILLVTIPTLLDHIAELEHSDLESERRAHALLARRGLTPAVVDQARVLLDDLKRAPATVPESPKLRGPTLEALWSWYLEWSQTARVVISDRRLLRRLGFGTST